MADYCAGDDCFCHGVARRAESLPPSVMRFNSSPDTTRLDELERRVDGLERVLNAALRGQPQGKHSKKSA